jgi:pantetheine-phosphate adenylyltransferase
MVERIAFFPGSFDPFTLGHADLLAQALNLADRVVVAIGVHPSKKPVFSFEERAELIQASAAEYELDWDRIDVVSFDGLVVDAARTARASILLRGLRDATDFDYEMQMTGMNGTMAPGLQTVFLPASPETRFITSTLVRQIASMHGAIDAFVPEAVATALKQKFNTASK